MAYGTVASSAERAASSMPSTLPLQTEVTGMAQDAASQSRHPTGDSVQHPEDQAKHDKTFWQWASGFYERNIGLLFVFVAQMFASIMAMTTRLLETGFETKFHALQIIFVRMFVTAAVGSAYMWYKQVPDFPLGQRGVRRLLVLRGMAGTTGLFGLYYSLSYLDISDATVITFLVPTLTAFVCFVALKEPFTANEALAGVIAFVGVLFIARPSFLFPNHGQGHNDPVHNPNNGTTVYKVNHVGGIVAPVPATPTERSIAVVCAVFGSFAAATAYATIRIIGKRTHSLVSVNYFSVLATVSSFLIIMIHPDLQFEIPQSTAQWILLASIGVSGFLLQVLLTEGLQREKAGRATNLMYTQMVFALVIERVVWGTTPPIESLIGSVLIIGAAVWVSLQKNKTLASQKKSSAADEESSLLGRTADDDST